MTEPSNIRLPPYSLEVEQEGHEPTIYLVESKSVQCSVCHRVRPKWKKMKYDHATGYHVLIRLPKNQPGCRCPYRGGCTGTLKQRVPHRVDITMYGGHGGCGCEQFEHWLGPELSKTHPSTWLLGRFRCCHIEQARPYSLDVTVRNHVRQQQAPFARGRQEQDGTKINGVFA